MEVTSPKVLQVPDPPKDTVALTLTGPSLAQCIERSWKTDKPIVWPDEVI